MSFAFAVIGLIIGLHLGALFKISSSVVKAMPLLIEIRDLLKKATAHLDD